jgi:hypothetical protein
MYFSLQFVNATNDEIACHSDGQYAAPRGTAIIRGWLGLLLRSKRTTPTQRTQYNRSVRKYQHPVYARRSPTQVTLLLGAPPSHFAAFHSQWHSALSNAVL